LVIHIAYSQETFAEASLFSDEYHCTINISNTPGADPGFQVREGALKKIAKFFGVFRVKTPPKIGKYMIFFGVKS
jgi:hypothetical protein